MVRLEDNIEKNEPNIHSEESSSNPLLFMLIPGAFACLEESIRGAGYLMIAGGLVLGVYDIAAMMHNKIRR